MGGYGPCRAGLYGEIHRRILNDVGYDPNVIFLWPPLKKPVDFIRKVKLLKGHSSWLDLVRVLRKCWAKLSALDELELAAQDIRPRELVKGETSRAFNEGTSYLKSARSLPEIAEAKAAAMNRLENIPRDEGADPLKVGIVGEIYVQLEPFANFYVEETLGHMGATVRRSIYLTSYTKHDIMSTRGDLRSRKLAAPYLPLNWRSWSGRSVGDVIRYSARYDVAQLPPSGIPDRGEKPDVPFTAGGIPV